MAEYGSQAVVWQTAINPVVALELLAAGTWTGTGVLGPEAFDAVPFLDLLTAYGSPWGMEERTAYFGLSARPTAIPPLSQPSSAASSATTCGGQHDVVAHRPAGHRFEGAGSGQRERLGLGVAGQAHEPAARVEPRDHVAVHEAGDLAEHLAPGDVGWRSVTAANRSVRSAGDFSQCIEPLSAGIAAPVVRGAPRVRRPTEVSSVGSANEHFRSGRGAAW